MLFNSKLLDLRLLSVDVSENYTYLDLSSWILSHPLQILLILLGRLLQLDNVSFQILELGSPLTHLLLNPQNISIPLRRLILILDTFILTFLDLRQRLIQRLGRLLTLSFSALKSGLVVVCTYLERLIPCLEFGLSGLRLVTLLFETTVFGLRGIVFRDGDFDFESFDSGDDFVSFLETLDVDFGGGLFLVQVLQGFGIVKGGLMHIRGVTWRRRYSLEVAFLCTQGAETFPVSNHFVASDCTLSFMEEGNGSELSKRRDAILWQKLTKNINIYSLVGGG